ncbi:sugar ABC transporter ATP-binding protein [Labrys wisconsinensis]|uniref:Ribose transport system ATP-binding protein n=1 Tax=Labrys wisconsinensis TaxID=425677 RepID=A0ABU0J2W9_9HYPH|nr:sugar ABC transporter ATP-binding protein [Labrys wisconsinensis]MDQ0467896.1 ribose transport system ATP-binding protein [Labrys wisconsinensis]
MSAAPPLRLLASSVTKAYGATVALAEVTLELEAGKVHALLGENGAGKSTLVKILSGVVQPNSGAMRLDGGAYRPHSILAARRAGVATAFQELSLPPNLSVAEALALPALRKGVLGLVSSRRTAEAAAAILARYRLTDVSPLAPIAGLSLAQRQRIEIARAMHHAGSVLVLDEPTAALTDVDWLFELVREKTAAGTAVLYISHRLAEVRQLCSAATVLRNGRSVARVELSDATDSDIFRLMVGRSELAAARPAAARSGRDVPVLRLRDVSGGKLRGVSLDLHRGEILGVAGLEGQGQRELFRTLVGLEPLGAGEIRVQDRPIRPSGPRAALAAGLSFLPEERKVEGIFPALTAASNVVLPVLQRISRAGAIWPALERRGAGAVAGAVELSARYLDFRIGELSGGNQQKALLARAMMTGAGTLLLYDPTRGVDVGTKQAIYAAIQAFAAKGGSVLLYSSELPELVRLADRCLAIYGGRVFAEFEGSAIEERALVAALTGHADAGRTAA